VVSIPGKEPAGSMPIRGGSVAEMAHGLQGGRKFVRLDLPTASELLTVRNFVGAAHCR